MLSRSTIKQGAELSKCRGDWLAAAVVCVEGKGEREVGSESGNALSVNERDIIRKNTRNIIVIVLV